jgi:hypothetical protein
MYIAKGSDVRPGVPSVSTSFISYMWENTSLGFPLVLCAKCESFVLPRARKNILAFLRFPFLLNYRRRTMFIVKGGGSDVYPGVPSVSDSFV